MMCLECIHIGIGTDNHKPVVMCFIKNTPLNEEYARKEGRDDENSKNYCPFSIEKKVLLKHSHL